MAKKSKPERFSRKTVAYLEDEYTMVGTLKQLGVDGLDQLIDGTLPAVETRVDHMTAFCFVFGTDSYGISLEGHNVAVDDQGGIEVWVDPQKPTEFWYRGKVEEATKRNPRLTRAWLHRRQRLQRSPVDVFKQSVRRPLPACDYWKKHEHLKQGSLCEQSLRDVPASVLQERVKALEAFEEDGFVYVGELAWIQSFLNKEACPENAGANGDPWQYGAWCLHMLNEHLLDETFAWATHATCFVDLDFRDQWTGKIIWKSKQLPQVAVTPALQASYSCFVCEENQFEFRIYGKEDNPSTLHAAQLFERLHNLPYYFELISSGGSGFHGDSDITMTEVELVEPNNVNQCSFLTEFNAWEFDQRTLIMQPTRDEWHSIRQALLSELPKPAQLSLSEVLSENAVDESQRFSTRSRRIIADHLDLFESGDRETIERYFFRWYDTIPGERTRFIGSPASIDGIEFPCEHCNQSFLTSIRFEWGSSEDFPLYKFGDSIRWTRFNHGREVNEPMVFVRCFSDLKCPLCESSNLDAILRIDEGVIKGLVASSDLDVQYVCEAPFVSEKLIPWEGFQNDWFCNTLLQLPGKQSVQAASLVKRWNVLGRQRIKDEMSWLLVKNRKCFEPDVFFEMTKIAKLSFLNPSTHSIPDLETPVKSTAVLKDVDLEDGKQSFFFQWGDLLDFPEYKIGDRIRWSSYAMGNRTHERVVAIGWGLGGCDCEIEIIDQKITGVTLLPYRSDRDIDFSDNPRDYVAYVGLERKPWVTWPDKEFIVRR